MFGTLTLSDVRMRCVVGPSALHSLNHCIEAASIYNNQYHSFVLYLFENRL
jgi:hypothetical protein